MYIVAVVLGALYFLTPVLYPISMIEGQNEILGWVIKLNPMTLVRARACTTSCTRSSRRPLWVIGALLVGGFLVFWAGWRSSIAAARTSGSCCDASRDFAVDLQGVGKRFRRHTDRRNSLKERIVRGRARNAEDFWAVRDVSLQIPKGSVYGLIGHNGSGKSTLLKMIGGIYRPTEGTITTAGPGRRADRARCRLPPRHDRAARTSP